MYLFITNNICWKYFFVSSKYSSCSKQTGHTIYNMVNLRYKFIKLILIVVILNQLVVQNKQIFDD